MEPYKLKVRIGQHEFEAEGPSEIVQKDYESFLLRVESDDKTSTNSASEVAKNGDLEGIPAKELTARALAGEFNLDGALDAQAEAQRLAKIIRREGDYLSLSAFPQGDAREGEAALLLLLGHKIFLGANEVTAVSLSQELKQSGLAIDRLDRVMNPYSEEGGSMILKTGQRRGARYRLTNLGMNKAREIAGELLKVVV
jgi:hypothetical protein